MVSIPAENYYYHIKRNQIQKPMIKEDHTNSIREQYSNMEASTGKCSAANSFLKILRWLAWLI